MNPFEEYRITSPFGWRTHPISGTKEWHTGIDLVKADKSPIYAFVAGEVIHAGMGATGSGFGDYGIVVAILDRSKGHLHCYAHLDSALVKVGSRVDKGQTIGRLGNTGRSTGPHLHYEIRKTHHPSYGWIADKPNMCFEPLQYLKEHSKVGETMILHERIRLVDGKLQYVPIATREQRLVAYANPGTDVRFMRIKRDSAKFKFVAEKGTRVSGLVKKHGADYGINFPFFHEKEKVPTGYVWAYGEYLNGPWGEAVHWPGIGFKGGSARIGFLTPEQQKQYDFYVQGRQLLVDNGKLTAKNIGDQTAQRTFIGLDINGDILIAISDGRTKSDSGLPQTVAGMYMIDKGAQIAIEGDGGGSTILADKTGGLNQAPNVGINERYVHHAILIYLGQHMYKDTDVITYGDLKKLKLI